MKLGTLCYIEKDNKYLMLHRVKKKNDMHHEKWVGLGGKFEVGESPEDCVKREIFEECGLTLNNPQLKGILTFPADAFDGEDWYVFVYKATSFTGELIECNEGDLKWIDKAKIDTLPMHGGDRIFTKWLEENNGIFSAKFYYDENGYKDHEVVFYTNI